MAILVGYSLFAYVLLLWGVTEKKLDPEAVSTIPFTAAIMRMMRNPPCQ